MLHQTDADGNWAGSRQSRDREWNLELIDGKVNTDSLSRAPRQLVHPQDGSFALHAFEGFDNDLSEEELSFVRRFVPPGAQRWGCWGG